MASLGLCGILAAALALCCACATAPTAASRRRPQVILHILADDLGWAELGYHNEEARIAGACVCVSDSLPPLPPLCQSYTLTFSHPHYLYYYCR